MTTLLDMSCRPQNGTALSRAEAEKLLQEIPGWILNDAANEISRAYKFGNYYETLAFVNALAWVVHREDHHPGLEVSYNRCTVHFQHPFRTRPFGKRFYLCCQDRCPARR